MKNEEKREKVAKILEEIASELNKVKEAQAHIYDLIEKNEAVARRVSEEVAYIANTLPVGYEIAREPKSKRRSFALQQSVLDRLAIIAGENDVTVNALVNDILLNYVGEFIFEEDCDGEN